MGKEARMTASGLESRLTGPRAYFLSMIFSAGKLEIITNRRRCWAADSICRLMLRFREGAELPRAISISLSAPRGREKKPVRLGGHEQKGKGHPTSHEP